MRVRSAGMVATAALLVAAGWVSPSGTDAAEPQVVAEWVDLDPRVRPPGANAAALAYDEKRRELVLFANGQTWLHRGEVWQRVQPEVEPVSRYGSVIAFDPVAEQVVLFGGWKAGDGANVLTDETWLWDGKTWREAEPGTSPGPRAYAAGAYDSARGELVVFGGNSRNDAGQFERLDDTWVWDGATWTQRATEDAPSPRHGSAMSYHPAREEVVLFGGSRQSAPGPDCLVWLPPLCVFVTLPTDEDDDGEYGPADDTWVWDGATWTQRATGNAPSPRSSTNMAPDPVTGALILFAGGDTQRWYDDTWLWDGSEWTEADPAESPERRISPAVATDPHRERVVLFGGHRATYQGDDTWGWDGETWASLEIPTPKPRIAAAMAHDAERGETVLFGGGADHRFDDTWIFDGGWERRYPAPAPPGRTRAVVAFDTARGETVVFGGFDERGRDLDDVWLWDGDSWRDATPAFPSLGPLPRREAAMAYDPVREEAVLFGGHNIEHGVTLGDTWVWDGSAWQPRVPLASPRALRDSAMAFDAARGEVVLFGGLDGENRFSGETWTWDGQTWTQHQPATAPSPRSAAAMVYDPTVQRVVLFSGLSSGAPDVWVWDGQEWADVTPEGEGPRQRSWAPMAFVPERDGAVAFGGLAGGYRDDTWLLRLR